MKVEQIGLQLYTARERTAKDMLGTLRELVAMGYRNFELAGYGDATPQSIRALLDGLGAQVISAHVGLDRIEERPQQLFEELRLLGCSSLVVPSVPEEQRRSREHVARLAERMNRIGALCQEAGLRLGYHNHAFEFAPLEDSTMWDDLTAALDPALVDLELDIYWAEYAGRDAAELIRKHGRRVSLLHVKDIAADESRVDVAVGDGRLSWPPILAAGAAVDARWYIVEQDNPDHPIDAPRRALANLRALAS